MKRLAGVILAIGVFGLGCASSRDIAKTYRESGKHIIASQYYSHPYLQNTESVQAKQELMESIATSQRNLMVDYEKAIKEERFRTALGLAISLDELAHWAHGIRLTMGEPNRYSPEVKKARKLALRAAIRTVDEFESDNAANEKKLVSLREAMALAPDDPELSSRYHRMLNRLRKQVRVKISCTRTEYSNCMAAKAMLAQTLTKINRELFVFSTDDSQSATFELVLVLTTGRETGQWQQFGAGQVRAKIPKLNDLKEPVKNKRGKPVFYQVKANYRKYRMTNTGQAVLQLRLHDLRNANSSVFDYSNDRVEKETKRYLTWNGDERAFSGHPQLTRLGTDQRMPTASEVLVRKAWAKLIIEASKKLLAVLEN